MDIKKAEDRQTPKCTMLLKFNFASRKTHFLKLLHSFVVST